MFRSKRKADYTLGICNSTSGPVGALLRHENGEPTLLRVFGGSGTEITAGLEKIPATSVSEPFVSAFAGDGAGFGGDGASGASDVFLTSEFGPISTGAVRPTDSDIRGRDLRAMLTGCRDAGAMNLSVVWCLGTPDVSWTEVQIKNSARMKTGGGKRPVRADDARSVFIPLASQHGARRFFAVTPRPTETASSAITQMRRSAGEHTLYCAADSEISTLLALTLTALQKDAGTAGKGTTLIARIGEDDVLALVVRDQSLEQVEILRSLSVHDGPEMICSRILLLQDEFGLSEVDRVYLTVAGDAERFIDSFETYFGTSRVTSLSQELEWLSPGNPVDAEVLPAVGAALRGVLGLTQQDNLLPVALRRPRRSVPYSWEVWMLLAFLATTAVFLASLYLDQKTEISDRYARIDALTLDRDNADRLRQRIDSLQVAYSVNMTGLDVLDSLLVGSDRWSRMFDRLTVEMSAVGDIWIEKWQPAGPIVILMGRAGSRNRVVDLARRLGGTIDEISYPTAEDPLLSFRVRAPVNETLPEAAVYLRERAAAALVNADAASGDDRSPIL